MSDDAAACTATAAATDNNKGVIDEYNHVDNDNDNDEDEKLPGAQPAIMSNKGLKKSPVAASAAKKGGA